MLSVERVEMRKRAPKSNGVLGKGASWACGIARPGNCCGLVGMCRVDGFFGAIDIRAVHAFEPVDDLHEEPLRLARGLLPLPA